MESSVPPDVHETVMEATYRALCANGFASLTMQDIADEAEKSTSLLHYHYDTKRDLLVAFLRYLLERFEEKFEDTEDEDPEERLRLLVSRMLPADETTDENRVDESDYDRFGLAILEVRMQAPYEEDYREQLRTNMEVIRSGLANVIEDGIETGAFRDVDPDRTARLIVDALDGARSERVTLDDNDAPTEVAAALDEFVLSSLVTGGDDA
ncbi:transcriptional regulator [Halogeometricum borinquense DSM 11551]|uniref:Transcriptional regulator n=1 Tax=Halogeometricum borinquense (strain ATCC 700274 / DSM 11551 / JCM 10706 / KCTC 4070 / PR3) TaxID=469382 RepID=E4NNJ4_HALBP|nr:TetR/AcrR family transcriptional regulator [Halogeometricum borinquense]ADQ66348.1 transcriptional regulator [Halogeometricum borinquense DSM 11551]ELY27662.1 transcriptional regulator [Halogeometricum borinquense DSM 11551]